MDKLVLQKIVQENIIQEVEKFKINISKHIQESSIQDIAVYCLCAFLDETIMINQINSKDLIQIKLLENFYNDSCGGDKFFIYLEKLINDKKKSLLLIEFIYIY